MHDVILPEWVYWSDLGVLRCRTCGVSQKMSGFPAETFGVFLSDHARHSPESAKSLGDRLVTSMTIREVMALAIAFLAAKQSTDAQVVAETGVRVADFLIKALEGTAPKDAHEKASTESVPTKGEA